MRYDQEIIIKTLFGNRIGVAQSIIRLHRFITIWSPPPLATLFPLARCPRARPRRDDPPTFRFGLLVLFDKTMTPAVDLTQPHQSPLTTGWGGRGSILIPFHAD